MLFDEMPSSQGNNVGSRGRGDPKATTTLDEINISIQELNLRQHHQDVRLSRIGKDLQSMHQVDMLAPVSRIWLLSQMMIEK